GAEPRRTEWRASPIRTPEGDRSPRAMTRRPARCRRSQRRHSAGQWKVKGAPRVRKAPGGAADLRLEPSGRIRRRPGLLETPPAAPPQTDCLLGTLPPAPPVQGEPPETRSVAAALPARSRATAS